MPAMKVKRIISLSNQMIKLHTSSLRIMNFQKQESFGMTLADVKTWTMIPNQTVTYVEMANNSLQYPKGHRKQQRDISGK